MASSPVVIRQGVARWALDRWHPKELSQTLGSEVFRVRRGPRAGSEQACGGCVVVYEGDCSSHSMTIQDVVDVDDTRSFYYLDYQYMREQFGRYPQLADSIDWSVLGLEGRGYGESTFWFGTPGAYTVCHQDSYGCNLVGQLHGTKLWVMFPPSDTPHLYPTRIPYEESSVFSGVNIMHPDLTSHTSYLTSHPHLVLLHPGDVLFLPKHWWHFVYCVEPSVSVNTWIDLASDHKDRLSESLVKLLVNKLLPTGDTSWLNPTEVIEDEGVLLNYVRCSLSQLKSPTVPPTSSTRAGGGGDDLNRFKLECEDFELFLPTGSRCEVVKETEFENYLKTINIYHPQIQHKLHGGGDGGESGDNNGVGDGGGDNNGVGDGGGDNSGASDGGGGGRDDNSGGGGSGVTSAENDNDFLKNLTKKLLHPDVVKVLINKILEDV